MEKIIVCCLILVVFGVFGWADVEIEIGHYYRRVETFAQALSIVQSWPMMDRSFNIKSALIPHSYRPIQGQGSRQMICKLQVFRDIEVAGLLAFIEVKDDALLRRSIPGDITIRI